MDLSIIIPVFEERQKIARDIQAAAAFLASQRLSGEIIVVDDGSRDGTAAVAKSVEVAPSMQLKVIRYNQNMGKGFAIREGVRAAQGEYIMFADSGLCVPYSNALRGLQLLKSGAGEIAHGSRRLAESKIQRPQIWYRRLTARIFRWMIFRWMKIPPYLTDTQCGFKIYRGDIAHKLYDECMTNGFIFDVEIILRALRKGYRIKEFPIAWTCDRDSRLLRTRSTKQIWRELRDIKQALKKE
ncbi:glycosyltransferase [candidate division KSB1 bacterium]|nr:glycosyltransferase [candidate division KSB1 bacterium]